MQPGCTKAIPTSKLRIVPKHKKSDADVHDRLGRVIGCGHDENAIRSPDAFTITVRSKIAAKFPLKKTRQLRSRFHDWLLGTRRHQMKIKVTVTAVTLRPSGLQALN